MDKNYETVSWIMRAANKIDGVYYLFAEQFGVNENTLAVLGGRNGHTVIRPL